MILLQKIVSFLHKPGIEPGTPTWKEGVLPLNYDRSDIHGGVSAAVGVRVKLWLWEGARRRDRFMRSFLRSEG